MIIESTNQKKSVRLLAKDLINLPVQGFKLMSKCNTMIISSLWFCNK